MASEISKDAAVLSVLSEMVSIFPLKEDQNDTEGFSWSGRVLADIGKPRIGGTWLVSSLATSQKPRTCSTNLIAHISNASYGLFIRWMGNGEDRKV